MSKRQRRQRKAVLPPPKYGDPTPERRQHSHLREVETIEAGVRAWQDEAPLKLDAYHEHRRITDLQHQAGEMYREMAFNSGKLDKGAFRYGAVGGMGEISDEFAERDRAFRDAARSIGSFIMATDALCLYDLHAPIAEVIEGLDRLAAHFGITNRRRRA
tara:strand:- start:2693 stop:3169 length:477 start_codon:yes stop_codon:yes gene_type:complete